MDPKKELNNKVILLRKSLKSIINQTKLNLTKKIKKLKSNEKTKQSASRKESELEALKRIKVGDIPLHDGVDSTKLQKMLTNPNSTEVDRATARVLLNPLVQKTVSDLKSVHGAEKVETFLKDNQKNIKKNLNQKKNKAKDKKAGKKKKQEKVEKESEDEDAEESAGSGERESEDELESENPEKSEGESSEQEEANSSESDEEELDKLPKAAVKKSSKPEKPAKLPVKPQQSQENPKPEPKFVKKEKKPKFDEAPKRSVDSFFLDSTGSNYLAAVTAADSDVSEDEDVQPVKKSMSHGKKFVQKIKKPIKSKRFDETPPAVQPFKKFKPTQQLQEKPKAPPAAEPDIHPSWKAKAEMRKAQIQDFKGTKIKFDD